ncbi:MAG: EAL domain-containing protein [Gammaproteobacteria bacterium SHHR-1]
MTDHNPLMQGRQPPWQALFDMLPDGVLILDPDTTKPLFFNHTACAQLGYSAEQFRQTPVSAYELLETPQQTRARVEKIKRQGRDDFITRHRRRDGSLMDVRVTVMAQTLDARQVFLCIFRDIGELRQAEEQCRTKSQFLAGVSHELRTPLNAILGYAQLIEMQPGQADMALNNAREITQAGQQLLDRLNQMLDLAQQQGQRAEAEQEARPPADPADRPTRVLIVEDHPANQILLKNQLRRIGYSADVAGDGQAALEQWRKADYDIILTDLNMPRMDGCQLARNIRQQAGDKRPAIIAITAAAISEELHRCREAGMDDALAKPVDLEQLRHLMARWLPSPATGEGPGETPPAAPPGPESSPPVQDQSLDPVLDIPQLYGLLGSQERGLCAEILQSFLDSASSGLAQLQAGSGGAAAIAQEMHKQKSSARTVGALRYARLAETLERQGRQGRVQEGLLAELGRQLEQVRQAVEGYLASPETAVTASPADEKMALSILVVDDDPVLLCQLRALLQGIGVRRVVTANTGREALARMSQAKAPFELLICDLNMPEMDGVEFTRKLAEQHYTGGIVLISGEDGRTLQAASTLITAQGLQVAGSLSKPVTQAALLPLLQRIAPSQSSGQRARPDGPRYTAEHLRQAIQRGELENHYQPKIELRSGDWIGVETLVRWRHPQDGLVFPDRFIDLAEAHGLIEELTRCVLDQALVQAQQWLAQGLDLRLAVNVSMDNLGDLDLPDRLARQVEQAGLGAERIILEVTESRLMRDRLTVLDILTRLRLKKFHLSIDDFGTGHSSLSQLRDLPFDQLKVDRSFVHGARHDPTKQAIYEASLRMGQQIGMEVVGEGVEDREDWDFLRNSGCHIAQGYFIARPMPAEQLIDWHRDWCQRLRDEGLI